MYWWGKPYKKNNYFEWLVTFISFPFNHQAKKVIDIEYNMLIAYTHRVIIDIELYAYRHKELNAYRHRVLYAYIHRVLCL